tara:strand:- start:8260 stop:8451 length:192 start_codon:yes stop_codon:yes gene_type:complete
MIKDDPAHLEYDYKKSRQAEYPSPEEWIIALVQKEIDDDSTEWDRLVERRSVVKTKYPPVETI